MSNLIKDAKKQILELLSRAYLKAAEEGVLPSGAEIRATVDIPRDVNNGDFASNFAMAAAKSLKKAPIQIAKALIERLELEGSFFASAEAAGAGFINFRLSPLWYAAVLEAVDKEGQAYGCSDEGAGKRVMVEFVSANPTGPMTIGNARGGVLGDTLASILSKTGWQVWREFYINDAGNQVDIFGRSVEARYLQYVYGEDYCEFPENGYQGLDIRELAKEFCDKFGRDWGEKPEKERREAMVSYGIERNIELMHRHLERYGITYDNWFRESSLYASDEVRETVQLLIDKGHTYEKDGALWFKMTDLGADKDEVLRRANGFYTYFAADMAYHRNKFITRGFDKVIDVLGADHHGHAVRFKAAIETLGVEKDRLDFLLMQLVRLTRDGEVVKVSKRTGKSITLNDLLDEISVDAVRFSFNAKPDTHLEFDMGLAVRQDSENPVYYVQYAHARICSLIAALEAEGAASPEGSRPDYSLLTGDAERELIKQIASYPDEILWAARDYDPSRINKYVIELASRFHRFYNAERIKGSEKNILDARLKLAYLTGSLLENGLGVLGVSAPRSM